MRYLYALLVMVCGTAYSQQVHWIYSGSVIKPEPVFVNKPLYTNEYWVVLSGGSGSTCSQAAPCALSSVVGKPGTTGTGGAVIHIKGTGGVNLFNAVLRGSGDFDCRTHSCDNWILITTWPAGSTGCATECTAIVTGNSNINSANVNHLMWDGGPDLKIHCNSNGANGTYCQNINSAYHIVYRTQTYCSGGNAVLGWQVGSGTVADHVYFINNEFHDCKNTGDQASAIYWGPGPSGGYTNGLIQNNIIRNWGGEGVEINPRVTSDGMQILGNLFYDNGSVTCNTNWKCRPHIVVSVQSGGGNNNTVIANNLMWNSWSGCIWARGGGTTKAIIVNNTCYNYDQHGGEDDNNPNPAGITDGTGETVKNNILYTTTGTPALEGTYTATNNACAGGSTCGTGAQTWTADQWISTSTASKDFLRINSSSAAYNTGAAVCSAYKDYEGKTRPQATTCDIGAYEVPGAGTPSAPSNPH